MKKTKKNYPFFQLLHNLFEVHYVIFINMMKLDKDGQHDQIINFFN